MNWLSHLPENSWLFLKATCEASKDFVCSVTQGQWLGLLLFILCGLAHWRDGKKLKTRKDPNVVYLKKSLSREKASRLTFSEQVHVLTYEKSGNQVSPASKTSPVVVVTEAVVENGRVSGRSEAAANNNDPPALTKMTSSNRFTDIGRRLRQRLFDNEAERKEKIKSFFRRKRKDSGSVETTSSTQEETKEELPKNKPPIAMKPAPATVKEVHLTVDTRPVVYNVSYSEEIRQALFLCNICVVFRPIFLFGNLHFAHALTNATDDHKIPRCLPQILTLPKFWYHLAHSFSRKNVPFDFERAF